MIRFDRDPSLVEIICVVAVVVAVLFLAHMLL